MLVEAEAGAALGGIRVSVFEGGLLDTRNLKR